MRGLPFPTSAQYNRELSHEYGSPINAVDPIPIDPALRGLAVDPAIVKDPAGEENSTVLLQVSLLILNTVQVRTREVASRRVSS